MKGVNGAVRDNHRLYSQLSIKKNIYNYFYGVVKQTSEANIFHFVHCLSVRAKAQVRSHVRPCEICGGQIYTYAGFSLITSVIPCQYNYVSVPLLFFISEGQAGES